MWKTRAKKKNTSVLKRHTFFLQTRIDGRTVIC